MTWNPMSDHAFPWEPDRLTIAVRDAQDGFIEVFVCTCSKGEYYPVGSTLSLNEMGWIPFAWTEEPPSCRPLVCV